MEAFNRRDFDTALQYMTEDATWAPFLARTETSLLQGKSEIRAAWERQFDVMDIRAEVLEVVAADSDRVVTRTLMKGRGHGSDLPIEGRFAQVFTFHNDLVTSVESYEGIHEALEAAGLSE
jgi:ketosteroid isomerase-like protein